MQLKGTTCVCSSGTYQSGVN